MTIRQRWIGTLAACALLGVLTEGAQHLTGRDLSRGDVARDVLGGLLALLWTQPASGCRSPRGRLLGCAVSAALLLSALTPLAMSATDEWLARRTFPLLADFETPFEAQRWESEARCAIDRSRARHGRASLRVDLTPGEYSGAALVRAPRDWRGYRHLRVEVFNPGPDALDVHARIHDGEHDRRGPSYRERYNAIFRLAPGWNALAIDLAHVKWAPAARPLDMGDVRGFMLFASRLPAPRSLFIDHVRLE